MNSYCIHSIYKTSVGNKRSNFHEVEVFYLYLYVNNNQKCYLVEQLIYQGTLRFAGY
jgi:hypothetical protein